MCYLNFSLVSMVHSIGIVLLVKNLEINGGPKLSEVIETSLASLSSIPGIASQCLADAQLLRGGLRWTGRGPPFGDKDKASCRAVNGIQWIC